MKISVVLTASLFLFSCAAIDHSFDIFSTERLVNNQVIRVDGADREYHIGRTYWQ